MSVKVQIKKDNVYNFCRENIQAGFALLLIPE